MFTLKAKPYREELVEVFDFVDSEGNPAPYTFRVRSILGSTRNKYEFAYSQACKDKSDFDKYNYYMAYWIAATCFNEKGEHEFSPDRLDFILNNFSSRDLNAVFNVASKLNGIDDEEKKSENSQPEAGSAS